MKKNNIITKIWLCMYPILFWFFSQIFVSLIFQFYYIYTSESFNTLTQENITNFIFNNTIWILLISSLINIIFFSFILKRKRDINVFKKKYFSNSKIFFVILLGISTYMLLMGIIDIFKLINYFPEYNNIIDSLSGGPLLFNILCVGIITPISEEMILRGTMYVNLKRFLNVKIAIMLQAFVFALIHMNMLQSAYAFIAGVLICYVYEKTDNLIYAILFHIAFNMSNYIFELPFLCSIMHMSILMIIVGMIIFIISLNKFKMYFKR